jgi:hypothetical protein
MKINEDKTQAIYFSHRRRPVEAYLTSKWRHILFVNNEKYLSVIVDKRITWTLHIETIAAKALPKFISMYTLLKIERVNVSAELSLYKALIHNDLGQPRMRIRGGQLPFEIAASAKNSSPHQWRFTRAHTGPRFACGFQNSVHTRFC